MLYRKIENENGNYVDGEGKLYEVIECNKCVYGVQHRLPDNYGFEKFDSKEEFLTSAGLKELSMDELIKMKEGRE